jgi:hypothetical protein
MQVTSNVFVSTSYSLTPLLTLYRVTVPFSYSFDNLIEFSQSKRLFIEIPQCRMELWVVRKQHPKRNQFDIDFSSCRRIYPPSSTSSTAAFPIEGIEIDLWRYVLLLEPDPIQYPLPNPFLPNGIYENILKMDLYLAKLSQQQVILSGLFWLN